MMAFLALWLVPAVLCYLLVGLYSKDWHFEDKDTVMIIPVVNIIVLGLVIIIAFDDWVLNGKALGHEERDS